MIIFTNPKQTPKIHLNSTDDYKDSKNVRKSHKIRSFSVRGWVWRVAPGVTDVKFAILSHATVGLNACPNASQALDECNGVMGRRYHHAQPVEWH